MLVKREEEEKKETPRILAFCGHLLLVLLLEHNAIVSDFLIVYQVWALQNLTTYLIFFSPTFPYQLFFFFSCSFFFFRTYISRARLVKRVRAVSLLSCARIFIPTLFSSLPYFRHTHKRARRAAFLAPKKKEKKRSVVCLVLLSLSLSSPFLTYSKQCHFEPLHTH